MADVLSRITELEIKRSSLNCPKPYLRARPMKRTPVTPNTCYQIHYYSSLCTFYFRVFFITMYTCSMLPDTVHCCFGDARIRQTKQKKKMNTTGWRQRQNAVLFCVCVNIISFSISSRTRVTGWKRHLSAVQPPGRNFPTRSFFSLFLFSFFFFLSL